MFSNGVNPEIVSKMLGASTGSRSINNAPAG